MTTREQALAEAAWNYLVKDHPWVAKDEYYKANPEKSMTRNAFLAGASWEAQRSAVLLEALEYITDPNRPSGPIYDTDKERARAALEKYRGKQ